MYWPPQKRSPKRIVGLDKKVKGHDNKKISGALHGNVCPTPTFKFFPAPPTVCGPMHNSVRYYNCKRRFMKLASTLGLLWSVPHGRRRCCWRRKSCHASSAADDFATSELVGWSSDAELHPSSNMSASSLVHLSHTQTRSDQHTHTHHITSQHSYFGRHPIKEDIKSNWSFFIKRQCTKSTLNCPISASLDLWDWNRCYRIVLFIYNKN